MTLTIRNARPWGGPPVDLEIADGRIAAIGPRLRSAQNNYDAGGAVLLPGLHDHHLHLLATAARRESVSLAGLETADAVAAALAAASGAHLRAVDYDERAAGLPDGAMLDRWVSDRPLRLQDRTGALWVLNGAAMRLLEGQILPAGAERDESGKPNGRFWREDRWLGHALPGMMPDIVGLGRSLAALGLTGLTDAGANNGPQEAALLAAAGLPQRMVLMGRTDLPVGAGYRRGAVKLLIDERDPPVLQTLATTIGVARGQGRPVAAHCVTDAELALFLAALDLAGGARAGDRIEHGGMIPADFIPLIADKRLTVVTNPGFIYARGDRYFAMISGECQCDLYRAASLAAAAVPIAGGSDAPYGSPDPWLAIRSAITRRSANGKILSSGEALDPRAALGLYLGEGLDPGGPERRIAVDTRADVVLCSGSIKDILFDPDAGRVNATFVAGALAFSRS